MVEFGGWDMPVAYTGIIEEHLAVRTGVGLFDVSHMGEFHIEGAEAEAFLDYTLTNQIAGTPVGKAVYSPMCDAQGGVVDDLIVYRTGDTSFLICVNASNGAKDFAWLKAHAGRFAVKLHDRSTDYALLALQGPRAEAVLNPLVDIELGTLPRFCHVESKVDGKAVRICRTGYTGEDGFELFCAAEDAACLAALLVAAGAPDDLKLCGLGARDSLRLEAGYPLYGHEISATLNPLQGGMGWAVKLSKDQFMGKAALEACKREGINPRVRHFVVEGRRIAREGATVFADGKHVGKVVSGTMSPVLGQPIGAAAIDVVAAGDSALYVDLRGHQAILHIRQPPLHKPI